MAHQGIFVTFEGTEGAGKSTLLRELSCQLRQAGFREKNLVLTREPGGSPVAERIREAILREKMDPWAELFLYEAARAEHLAQVILPGLRKGALVLCDRFTDSSLAYQAFARGLPWKSVKTLNAMATRGLEPDLTVLLDIDPRLGLRRAQERTRFEAEGARFQEKVRRGFLKSRSENPRRWLVLKVESATPAHLASRVLAELSKRFGRRIGLKS